MKIELTIQERKDIKTALYLAEEWEKTVIESQKHVDWLNQSTKESKRIIKRFQKISRKLIV